MSGFYKVADWTISTALLSNEFTTTGYRLKAPNSDVIAIQNLTGQQLSLSVGSGVNYAHEGLQYEVGLSENAVMSAYFISSPAVETGLVFIDKSAVEPESVNRVLDALLGINIWPSSPLLGYEIEVNPTGSFMTITLTDGVVLNIVVSADGYTINGALVDISTRVLVEGLEIEGDLDTTISAFITQPAINEVATSPVQIDAGYNEYSFDDTLGLTLSTASEVEIVLSDTLTFDEFGVGYKQIVGTDAYVSNLNSYYLNASGNKVYPDVDQHVIVLLEGNVAREINLSQVSSSVNTLEYQYDLIESSERVYIGYMRTYSSYILIDYYFSKKSVAVGECATIADTSIPTRAIRLKVYANSIVSQYPHASIAHIAAKNLSPAEITDAYQRLPYGIGFFKSPYKIYYYRDLVTSVKIIYNRELSTKLWTLEVFDQTTRWKAVLTITNGPDVSVAATKYLNRYDNRALWDIYPLVGPTTILNMKIKRAYDNVIDVVETSFRNDAIDLDAKTIKLYTRILYLNISNVAVAFPQLRLSFTTLSVMELAGNFVEIVFQQASGAIYGRYKQGTVYSYLEKDILLEQMNAVDVNYQFAITCNISRLLYFDEAGLEQNIPFSDSTLIVAEKIFVNGLSVFRIYYKNASDDGFVIANNYSIEV